ncbi:MAG: hypothetical protein Q8R28_18890 [Dehalococcoidia bacterium]|nr:hypothetical protein [Dehalococcoidia bacterium]
MARGGLVVVYEMAPALGIPQAMDRELPPPGSRRGYNPSRFVMPMLLMFHGGARAPTSWSPSPTRTAVLPPRSLVVDQAGLKDPATGC